MRVSLLQRVVWIVILWALVIITIYYLMDVFRFNDADYIGSGGRSFMYGLKRSHSIPHFSEMNYSMSLKNDGIDELLTSNGGGAATTHIYMDWPANDKLFSVQNYKALESILYVYPTASIRVLLTAPRDANHYKIGKALSMMQFNKYKRRSYNINVMPINYKQKMRSSAIGEPYRNKWFARCCQPLCGRRDCSKLLASGMGDHRPDSQQQQQPYHLYMYNRVTSIWLNGGIFTDFSFLFLGPLSKGTIQQGYFIHYYCRDLDSAPSDWRLPVVSMKSSLRTGSGIGFNRTTTGTPKRTSTTSTTTSSSSSSSSTSTADVMQLNPNCVTSTLLVFNVPKSPALLCVLRHYEDENFIDCIESDSKYGGAACIKRAFKKCFREHKTKNELAVAESRRSKSTSASAGILEAFGAQPSEAALALLSVNWTIFEHKRVLWLGDLAWSGNWNHYPYLEDSLLGAAVGQIKLQSLYVKTKGGSNRSSRGGSSSSSSSSSSSTGGAAQSNGDSSSSLTTSSSSSSGGGGGGGGGSHGECAIVAQCHHYYTNHSQLGEAGGTGSDETSYDTGIEQIACAPAIALVGFKESASSFLFKAMTQHPNILPALTGMFHKETNCYSTSSSHRIGATTTSGIGNEGSLTDTTSSSSSSSITSSTSSHFHSRARCFPYIEAGEQFISIDGTVGYSTDAAVPARLHRDNPEMKILFVVRNPVERLYSHYRNDYERVYSRLEGGAGLTFDAFVMPAFESRGKFGVLRDMVLNGAPLDEVVEYYYHTPFRSFPSPETSSMKDGVTSSGDSDGSGSSSSIPGGRGVAMSLHHQMLLDELFMHSLYVLPILHYVRQFGANQVKIVTTADILDERNSVHVYETLNSIFRFVGVCPVPITDLVPSLPHRNDVPYACQMSQGMYVKLRRFFRPFNDLLANVTTSFNVVHDDEKNKNKKRSSKYRRKNRRQYEGKKRSSSRNGDTSSGSGGGSGGSGGLNVTVWNTKTPPPKLPLYSTLWNSTTATSSTSGPSTSGTSSDSGSGVAEHPLLWFEMQEPDVLAELQQQQNMMNKASVFGKFKAHLLPKQMMSVEEGGYNTTIGMLNTF